MSKISMVVFILSPKKTCHRYAMMTGLPDISLT